MSLINIVAQNIAQFAHPKRKTGRNNLFVSSPDRCKKYLKHFILSFGNKPIGKCQLGCVSMEFITFISQLCLFLTLLASVGICDR